MNAGVVRWLSFLLQNSFMQHVSHTMSSTISDQEKGKTGSFLFLFVHLCAAHAVTQQEGLCLTQIPIRAHRYKFLFAALIKRSLGRFCGDVSSGTLETLRALSTIAHPMVSQKNFSGNCQKHRNLGTF